MRQISSPTNRLCFGRIRHCEAFLSTEAWSAASRGTILFFAVITFRGRGPGLWDCTLQEARVPAVYLTSAVLSVLSGFSEREMNNLRAPHCRHHPYSVGLQRAPTVWRSGQESAEQANCSKFVVLLTSEAARSAEATATRQLASPIVTFGGNSHPSRLSSLRLLKLRNLPEANCSLATPSTVPVRSSSIAP